MPTKADIIAELETLGVDFDPSERKADLEELLDAAVAEVEPAPVAEEVPTAVSHMEEATNRCRQCKQPGDHKHIGV